MSWYIFTPGVIIPEDPSDHNQYTLIGSTPPTCASQKQKICAIVASDFNGQPIFTTPLLREIIRVQHYQAESGIVMLRPA